MSILGHPSETGAETGVDALVKAWPGQCDTVVIDIEGACNLRCVYCYQSDKDFVPHKGMSDAVVEAAVRFAKTYGRGAINVTSQGEFTHAKNWRATAAKLLAAGVSVHCTSNLSRPLDRDEIETLSNFAFICLSLDTADRETLRAVRRSADIRAIADNVLRIRAAAAGAGREPPQIVVNCVLSTANARQLPDLAAYCYSLGIGGIHVAPLHAYGDFGFDKRQLGDAAVYDPVAAGSPEDLRALAADIAKAAAIAVRMGRWFAVAPAIGQRLEARLAGIAIPDEIPPGFTRLCQQPWDRAVVNHDGTVSPCCYGAETVGNVATEGVEAVMRGEKLAALRRALVTGENLPAACRSCVGEPIGPVSAQRARVAQYLDRRR